MIYRIGQRVKVVITNPRAKGAKFNGAETVITGPRAIDQFGEPYYPTEITAKSHCIGVLERCLVPLTDPSADSWASEKVRELERLAKEPMPRTKEKA